MKKSLIETIRKVGEPGPQINEEEVRLDEAWNNLSLEEKKDLLGDKEEKDDA